MVRFSVTFSSSFVYSLGPLKGLTRKLLDACFDKQVNKNQILLVSFSSWGEIRADDYRMWSLG